MECTHVIKLRHEKQLLSKKNKAGKMLVRRVMDSQLYV